MSTKKTKKEIVKTEAPKKVAKIIKEETRYEKVVKFFKENYQTIVIFTTGILVGLGFMFIVGYGNIATLKNGEKLVASIKGYEVTAENLYEELKDANGLNSLLTNIDEFILNKEYGSKKADAKKYADDYIASLKTQYTDNWDQFLSYYGFADETALNESLQTQYYANLTTEDYVKTLITDKDIEKYYNDEVVGDIKVSHILIKADYAEDATDAEKSAAKKIAEQKVKDLIKELEKSDKPLELFAKLAKENSDDTSNASKGGDLGYFNKDEMQEPFETAAYKLTTVGEFTKEPVETTYGYHIIIKTDKTKEKASLKDSKENIIDKLVESKVSADQSLPIVAKSELRKEYKLTFEEEKMKKAYNTLIEKQIKDAKTPTTTN